MNIQMSYLIGALVIFTMLAVMFNQKENLDLDSRLYHEAVGAASEIGNALLNQLSKLPFDEHTVSESIEITAELTSKDILGPETGELNISQFDDIDDYNYFDGSPGPYGGSDSLFICDTLKTLGIFKTKVKVHYIQKESPDVVSGKEWHKIIHLEIKNNKYIPKKTPIKLFLIMSY